MKFPFIIKSAKVFILRILSILSIELIKIETFINFIFMNELITILVYYKFLVDYPLRINLYYI